MIRLYIPASKIVSSKDELILSLMQFVKIMRNQIVIETSIYDRDHFFVDHRWRTNSHTVNMYVDEKPIDNCSIGNFKYNHASIEDFFNHVIEEVKNTKGV